MMNTSGGLLETTTRRPSRNVSGFTLIEVMIVIGMLSFGLLSLSAMQIHAMKGSDRGRHGTNAAAIAENRMELLQQDPWADIGVTGGFVADPVEYNNVQVSGSTSPEGTYGVFHQITDLEAGFTRAIDVQVLWTEKNGEARSVTLSSVRYNREGT
jgi:prepilin-type N-terminal cleavage/methylation domain-containing protein